MMHASRDNANTWTSEDEEENEELEERKHRDLQRDVVEDEEIQPAQSTISKKTEV